MKKNNLLVLETNIDDMNPELYDWTIETLVKEGAREAFVQPIVMKKNRIGALLTVVCPKEKKNKLIERIFDETTAFGIRISEVAHVGLEKEIKKVKTKYGLVSVKIGTYKGKIRTVSPEYEDCKKLSKEKGIPLKKIYNEAKRAFEI